MKKLILLMLMLAPLYLAAQQKGKAAVKKIQPKSATVKKTAANKGDAGTLWIMDSVRVTQAEVDAAVKRMDLAELKMLSKDEAQALYHVDNVGMIITKVRAKREYKENFSAVSPAYKKYITDNYGVDNAVAYYVDGVLVDEVRPLTTIWQASKKVMVLTFTTDSINGNEKGKPAVFIITNKQNNQ